MLQVDELGRAALKARLVKPCIGIRGNRGLPAFFFRAERHQQRLALDSGHYLGDRRRYLRGILVVGQMVDAIFDEIDRWHHRKPARSLKSHSRRFLGNRHDELRLPFPYRDILYLQGLDRSLWCHGESLRLQSHQAGHS